MNVVHIVVAMKPIEGNFADNAIELGVAGLDIDDCRIGTIGGNKALGRMKDLSGEFQQPQGPFPANVIHDGSDEIKSEFPHTASNWRKSKAHGKTSIWDSGKSGQTTSPDDSGNASRFFKECKA